MREVYKNRMLYYLIAPILACLWPLAVAVKYLPEVRQEVKNTVYLCGKGCADINDIYTYDPERRNFSLDRGGAEFSFAKAIERVANLCRIPSASCDYTAGGSDQKTQNAKVTLKSVGIVQAAQFLSSIQSMWVGLKCDQVKLTKKKGMPDQWDVEMKFWYAS